LSGRRRRRSRPSTAVQREGERLRVRVTPALRRENRHDRRGLVDVDAGHRRRGVEPRDVPPRSHFRDRQRLGPGHPRAESPGSTWKAPALRPNQARQAPGGLRV
jgi:hypothetical protein